MALYRTKQDELLESLFLEAEDSEDEDTDDPRDRFIFFGILISMGFLVVMLINTGLIIWLANKPQPTLVRDSITGEAFRVRPSDAPPQESDVLNFVVDKMHRLHTWTGTIPSKQDPGLLVSDPGVIINDKSSSKKITTAAYEASFSLTESIRPSILGQIASQTPQQIFDNDPKSVSTNFYVVLAPRKWIKPKNLGKGRWMVTLIADLEAFSPSHPQGKLVSRFNKDIYITESPEIPLLYPDALPQFLAYLGRSEGFEIENIADTQLGEIRAPR